MEATKMAIVHQIYSFVLACFFLLFTPAILLAESDLYSLEILERKLLSYQIESLDNTGDTLSKSNLIKSIVEFDTRCIPILAKAIKSENRTIKAISTFGLSIIGTDDALQILQQHAEKSGDEIEYLTYLEALCGRGTPQDLSVVVNVLKENRSRFLTGHTAFHLAYLHPDKYKKNIKNFEISKENQKYFEQLISQKGQLSVFENNSIINEILSQIIFSGIPRLNERKRYIDKENNNTWNLKGRIWKLKKGVWHSNKGITESEASYSMVDIERAKIGLINFSSYISSDETRALVDVSLIFGGLNGSGYVYALKKINGKWQVTYFTQTWIS